MERDGSIKIEMERNGSVKIEMERNKSEEKTNQ